MVDVEFEVGNFCKALKRKKDGKDRYSFTAFVRLKDKKNRKAITKLVSQAKFILHESFKTPFYTTKSKDGDEMICATWDGWGRFEMPVQIYWTKESGNDGITTFEFDLSFDKEWVTTHTAKVDSKVIEKYFTNK